MQEDKNTSSNLFVQPANVAQLFATHTAADDNNELRKRREEFALDIRSKDREQDFNLKRKAGMQQQQQTSMSMIPSHLPLEVQAKLKEQIQVLAKTTFTTDQFSQIVTAIHSEDIIQKHWGVTGLRKILSVEVNELDQDFQNGPPIQPVIDSNLVPTLIEIINKEITPQLTLEASWALTNVASGTTQQTQTIIDKGGIALFCKLLSSPFTDIAEQAVWAIGNIAGDCAQYRDLILRTGGVDPLIKIITKAQSKNTIKHGTWALSNLCRGKPLPDFKYVRNATPILCKVIMEETDQEVLTDACWALSYLSDGENTRIQQVIDTGVVPTLVRLLDHHFLSILIPALRVLGNLVTGDDKQTNFILEHQLLKKLAGLVSHEKKPVRREVCWAISNITAGTEGQISQVIREPGIIEKLLPLMKTDTVDIRREAAWSISNATNHGSTADIYELVRGGLLNVLTEMLDCSDIKTLVVVLEAVSNVLKRGDLSPENEFLNQFEALGGVRKLELLQKHQNMEVYHKAFAILERYYETQGEL